MKENDTASCLKFHIFPECLIDNELLVINAIEITLKHIDVITVMS